MKQRIARLAVAVLLLTPAAAACDREDVRDAEEAGNEVDQQIDKIDSDGKDD